MATPTIIGDALPSGAGNPQDLAHYEELKDSLPCWDGAALSGRPQGRRSRPQAGAILTQPFFATEQFSGIKGKDVSLQEHSTA